jgi:hypothetical protein
MGIAGIGFLVAERRLLVTAVVAIAVVVTAMMGLELDANGVSPALVPVAIAPIELHLCDRPRDGEDYRGEVGPDGLNGIRVHHRWQNSR